MGGGYSSAAYTVTYYTPIQCVYNLSAGLVDSSSIQVNFNYPKNSYNTSYYYTLSEVNGTYGYITNVSGSTSPLLIQNLSASTNYTWYIKNTIDTLYTVSSNGLSVTTKAGPLFSSVSISSYDNSQINTGGFVIYVFRTPKTYTITYTSDSGGNMSIFMVGGGGQGGGDQGGGGGGGGVIQKIVNIPSGSSTISLLVGNVSLQNSNSVQEASGNNTTMTFTAISTTYTAYGGGAGASRNNALSGGSGGGGNASAKTLASQSTAASSQDNSGNSGGGYYINKSSGGGGGAGSSGVNGTLTANGNGGIGVQITIEKIKDYIPYQNYYWGGGGGGGSSNALGSTGGLGGGGGGCGTSVGSGGGSAINSGGSSSSTTGGNGGANTGGGGGGGSSGGGGLGGKGGSGIIIIAFNV